MASKSGLTEVPAGSKTPVSAIVVGGGHNGLTAAFYLARAGLDVQIIEQRERLGGCAVTEEIDPESAPGCRVSTASYMASTCSTKRTGDAI